MTIDTIPTTSPTTSLQRSLRHCIARMAVLLYQHGHALETISVPHKGLDSNALHAMEETSNEWSACQQVLEESGAATFNDQDHLVLTALGRDLLFDMFGEGAADCG
jgi:hypothetical protein